MDTSAPRVDCTKIDGSGSQITSPLSHAAEPTTVSFLPWRSWRDRAELRGKENEAHAGLYVLARFAAPPESNPVPSWLDLPAEVFYVGMSKNLHVRPLRDQPNGKRRYRNKFKDDRGFGYFYVSVAPVFPADCPDQLRWYILLQYLEAKVAWKYALKHGVPLHVKNMYQSD